MSLENLKYWKYRLMILLIIGSFNIIHTIEFKKKLKHFVLKNIDSNKLPSLPTLRQATIGLGGLLTTYGIVKRISFDPVYEQANGFMKSSKITFKNYTFNERYRQIPTSACMVLTGEPNFKNRRLDIDSLIDSNKKACKKMIAVGILISIGGYYFVK